MLLALSMASALLAVDVPTSESARPTVAVAPFVASQDVAWASYLLADSLTGRLLVHSRFNPKNLQRFYPLNVFGWRQVAAAARGDAIELGALTVESTERLRRTLGADWMLVGNVGARGNDLVIEWRLVGESSTIGEKLTTTAGQLIGAAETVAAGVLRSLGQGTDVLSSHKQEAISDKSARVYGAALQRMAAQSLDPRAGLVLKPAELEQIHAALGAVVNEAPMLARAWVERGLVSAMLGKHERAEGELAQAMAGGVEPATSLGLYYFYDRQAKTLEGAKALEEATMQHLGFLQGLGYLGQAYFRIGKYHDALQVFSSYVQRVPRSPWARVQRAAALARTGKLELALTETQAVLAEHPASVMVWAALAARQIDAKKYDEARATLKRALEKYPDHAALLVRQAYVALMQGKADEALAASTKAVQAVGEGRGETLAAYAYVNLGHAHLLRGDRAAAYQALAKAKTLGADTEDLRVLLRDERVHAALDDSKSPVKPAGLHAH